jgi:hypothetical protein
VTSPRVYPPLADRFADEATRHAAAEVAVIAHLVINPALFDGWRTLFISPACVALVELLADMPALARADLVAAARIASADCAGGSIPEAVLAMAADVAAVTVAELAAIGPADVVLSVVGVRPKSRRRVA